jgi:hypothetical protein
MCFLQCISYDESHLDVIEKKNIPVVEIRCKLSFSFVKVWTRGSWPPWSSSFQFIPEFLYHLQMSDFHFVIQDPCSHSSHLTCIPGTSSMFCYHFWHWSDIGTTMLDGISGLHTECPCVQLIFKSSLSKKQRIVPYDFSFMYFTPM